MCKFTAFRYLYGCRKLKIIALCDHASRTYHGVLSCARDPHPENTENFERQIVRSTYGFGVCASVTCALVWRLLPRGEFGKTHESWEDDSEIEEGDEAAAARENRWYRECLSNEQQLDCFGAEWPVGKEDRSDYARVFLTECNQQFSADHPERKENACAEQLMWKELNPRYMSASVLHKAMYLRLLPVSMASGRRDRRTSPLKPSSGPFRFREHCCRTKPGICKGCGENVGREKTFRANALEEEHRWLTKANGLSMDDTMLVLSGQTDGFEYLRADGVWRRCKTGDQAIDQYSEFAANEQDVMDGLEATSLPAQGLVDAATDSSSFTPPPSATNPNVFHFEETGMEMEIELP